MDNTMTRETDRLTGAREQGQAQFDSIAELIARYRAATDDEVFEATAQELAEAAGCRLVDVNEGGAEDGIHWAKGDVLDDDVFEDEDAAWLACCEANDLRPDEDDARQAIEEDALSVEVRSGWTTPGHDMEAEEFCILLCTGGPACRIVGDLDRGSPTRAYMQVQDWFTAWTDFFPKGAGLNEDVGKTLLAYASVFYFGE